jgi:hypothetical protein
VDTCLTAVPDKPAVNHGGDTPSEDAFDRIRPALEPTADVTPAQGGNIAAAWR